MNCRKVCSLLSAYMDGELTGMESLRVRDHLSKCPACDSEYRSILDTKLMICSLPVAEPDPDFEQRLLAGLQDLKPERGRLAGFLAPFALDGQRSRLRAAGLFAAASLIALALSVRLTVTSEAKRSASATVAHQIQPNDPWSLREQDLRFAHETFERPQPVNAVASWEDASGPYRQVAHPVSALDAADSPASP